MIATPALGKALAGIEIWGQSARRYSQGIIGGIIGVRVNLMEGIW